MMKISRQLVAWVLLVMTVVVASACADLEVVNQNDPDRERALASATDVEALIYGAYQNWWSVAHYGWPAAALSVAADAHSSSWGNWGMRDSGWEPRKAYNNDAAYSYSGMASVPWTNSYRALAAVRDGFLAIENGLEIREDGGSDNTPRAVAFGKLIQAMALSNVAVTIDQGFIIDETVEDVANVELVDYNAVWAAAEAKFNEVIQLSESGGFTIPSAWVGKNGAWTAGYMSEIARTYRGRYRSQVPRTPQEREAVDWSALQADVSPGISREYAGNYGGSGDWGWHRSKLHTATWAGWARMDYRTIGPADASGAWETWINTQADNRTPFHIDTDDRRITGGTPQTNGKYIRYLGNSPFPADRGTYHYSHYIDRRWDHLRTPVSFIGEYPDMTPKELEFLNAEAAYRKGDMATAMATVNKYRTENGELPPFTDPNGLAPGGERCVPQMPDGSCGDLWEAYKYEKRIELFHYGYGTEYFDDRGWGDLVTDTFQQLPIPSNELELLLMAVYTFGGPGGDSSAPYAIDYTFVNDVSPDAIKAKLEALEAARERDRERIDDYHVVRN